MCFQNMLSNCAFKLCFQNRLSKYAFKMCFQNVLSKCDSTQGFRGDSGGIPRDSVWVCRDSMGFRVGATMSFHTSGASGISPIIILEARMLEIPGCESPYLALSSSVYKALYLPLVSTVLEFFYRILESAPVLLGSRSFPALQPLPHPAPPLPPLVEVRTSGSVPRARSL